MVEFGINFMTLQMATKSWSTLALGLVVFVVLLAYVQAQPYDDHLGKLNRNFASGSGSGKPQKWIIFALNLDCGIFLRLKKNT